MATEPIRIQLPITPDVAKSLRAGDSVLLNGSMLTARDAAHIRLAAAAAAGEPLPVSLEGQTIYYLGPAPAKPGMAIGAAGPTSSYRMDRYTPLLLSLGLRGMLGKGDRSAPVIDAIREWSAVYFAAVGGTAALLAKHITASKVIAYEDLGPEAIRCIEVKNFPAFVAIDCVGGDLYKTGPAAYGIPDGRRPGPGTSVRPEPNIRPAKDSQDILQNIKRSDERA